MRERTWTFLKIITTVGTVAGAFVAVGGAWKFFDLPMPAFQTWVIHQIEPFHDYGLIALRAYRQAKDNELFLWKTNPQKDSHIEWNIRRLENEIADLDRQINSYRKKVQ